MTAINWKTGGNGNFEAPANWSTGAVPTSADDATIAAPGTYTVTISAGTDDVHSLTLNAAGATLLDMSPQFFTVGSALTVNAGTLELTGFTTVTSANSTGAFKLSSGGTLLAGTGGGMLQFGTITTAGLINTGTDGLSFSTAAGNVSTLGGTLAGIGGLNLGFGGSYVLAAAGLAGTSKLNLQQATVSVVASSTLAASLQGYSATLAIGHAAILNETGAASFSTDPNAQTAFILSGPGTLATKGASAVGDLASKGTALELTGGLAWINGGTVTDNGVIAFNDPNVGADTARIVNTAGATFNINGADANLTLNGTGTDLFTNTGIITRSGDSATSTVAVPLVSTGTINVTAGQLDLTGGGTLSGTLGGTGTLDLANGTFALGAGGLAGIGTLEIQSLVNVSASNTVSVNLGAWQGTLSVAKGVTQTLSGAVQFSEPFVNFSGFTLSGLGTVSTTGVVTINSDGSDGLVLGGGVTWINSGIANDDDGVLFSSGQTATILNTAAGTFNVNPGGIFSDGTGLPTFVNAGLLTAVASGGFDTNFSAAMRSTGTINISAGTLEMSGGGTISGTLSGAGTLSLDSGSYTIGNLVGSGTLRNNGATVTYTSATINTAYVLDNNATLAVSAGKTLTLAGQFTVGDATGGGTIAGPGTLVTSGATTINNLSGTQVLLLNGGLNWINAVSGTVTELGLVTSNGAVITNRGVFNVGSDAGSLTAATATDVFNNIGTLAKTAGTGTSLVTEIVTSTGTINVATGTLALGNGGSVSGVLSGAGALHLGNGNFTTAGLSGNGSLVIDNLAGVGYGTLTATTTSTITANVRVDGNATLGAAAGVDLTLTGPLAINTVESTPSPDGGSLIGPGTLTTTGATTVGTVTNGNNFSALALTGGITWINTGTVSDAGAGTSNGATISNAGTFDFTADTGAIIAANAADIFKNTGTLAKTAGTGTSLVTEIVTSTGTINVATGTLALGNGGSVSGVLSGAGALHLGNGNFTTAGLSGNGSLVIDNLAGVGYGTLTATTTSTITANVRVDGNATLGAAAGVDLTLTGPLAINTVESTPSPDGGSLIGPGTLTTTGATTVGTVTNGNNFSALALTGGITWINTGTVSDAGAGTSNGATISNAGTFDFTADTGAIIAANAADIFKNTGTLAKTAGTGTSLVTEIVTSTGTINVATGTLALGNGGSVSGVLSGAGALHLSNGNFTTAGLSGNGSLVIDNLAGVGYGTLTATTTSTITANVRVDGNATLGAAAGVDLTLTGPLAINTVESTPSPDGGSLAGPGTLTTTGATTVGTVTNGNNFSALALTGGITWINTGTVSDAGAGTSNGATISNAGTFDFTADTGAIIAANATDAFHNIGTLGKTAGTGTSTLNDAITNTGTIAAASGTLVLTSAVAGAGAMDIGAGATLDIATVFASQSVTFTGGAGATLRLESPASATLSGFGAGDRLDLVGSTATAATIAGNTLTVTNGAGIFTYVSAGLAGDVATIAADNAGGSIVSLYRAATATHTPGTLAFGNHHVGDVTANKLSLTISNSDVADGYSEKLNSSFGSATAGFTAAGSANALAAGTSNSTSLTATLDTSTAGAKSGTAKLTLASNGSGVDGSGFTALPSQTVALTGAVYAYAAAHLTSTAITLGNQHAGATATASLTLGNIAAAGGFSESLDARFTAGTGNASGTGTATGIAAGTSTTTLGAGLTATSGGLATGTETLTFASDGAGTSGLGTTTLGTQTVSITGTFYNLAGGQLGATTIAFGNHHVGDTVTAAALALTNTAVAGPFSEALDAVFGTAGGGIATSGSLAGLAAGSTNATTLQITESTATAGALTGSVVLGLSSDGTGMDGLGTTALTGQTITVTGGNYALASGTLATTTVSLGIIHAATAATGALSLTNAAPTGGYGESLDAGLSGASAGLSTAGSITGLLAGANDASTLHLAVNTAITGAYTGTATLGLVSDGAGTSGLGTTALAGQTVTVVATVDNYALASFVDPTGPVITGTSTNATINLGSTLQGAAALALTFGAQNTATGTADLLTGTIGSLGATGFSNGGLGTLGTGLSAGQSETAQTVSLATTTAGIFTETILLSTSGTNASGYSGALGTETLTITGTITPSVFTTYTLALGPNAITGTDGKGDVFVASAGALNSRDQLTGGNGANSITLAGAGLFDVNAPALLANIPVINAHEGQIASGTHAGTAQTVLLRDGVTDAITVAAGIVTAGNPNPQTIAIYGGTGTDTIKLAAGADHVFLGTGTDGITLGGTANTIQAGGGIATVHATAAFASAGIIGLASGSTTLAVSTAGTVTLNAADTHLTVQLSGAGMLRLDAQSFITAIGSAGADTIIAGAAGQTLTGGLGTDSLVGSVAGNDMFADTAAGFNRDTIGNWTSGDQLDVRDIAGAAITYQAGTLTVMGGGHTTAITMSGSFSAANFVVLGSDGAGGTLIGFHT